MGSNQTIAIPVPANNGLGASINVATASGNKSVAISGNYNGLVVLQGSHDGVTFVPLLIFDSGAGGQSYKQSLSIVVQFVRVLRNTGDNSALTMTMVAETTTLNNFINLASLTPISNGVQASVDIWTLVASTGLDSGFSIIGKGALSGLVTIEGSPDNISFNPIGSFSANPQNSNLLEYSPIVVRSIVRFVRVRVTGKILSTFVVTIGGVQNTSGVSTGGKAVLKFTCTFASNFVIQNMFMADDGLDAAVPPQTVAVNYPMPACTVSSLIVKAQTNGRIASVTATVFKNNVATLLTVTVTAGSTAVFSDLVDTVAFAVGDVLDIRLHSTADGTSGLFAATLEAVLS